MDNAEPPAAAARRKAHVRAGDLRGAGRLAVDATRGLTRLVEHLHHNILRAPAPLDTPSGQATGGVTGLVYRSIHGVTRLVGGSLDALLGQVERLLPPDRLPDSPQREAVLAALNGVLGDHLAATANPLAITMQLRGADGAPAALPLLPGTRVLLMVHGLCMNAQQWRRNGRDNGAALAAEGGLVPLYLQYNSGLPVAANGRLLADLLQVLQAAELSALGHSMGGLVLRSAVHQGRARGDSWPQRLQALVFLGTPHQGAPLERGGHWIDTLLGASPYTAAFARLGKLRSAGITDLRHGALLADGAMLPLPAGVACYAVAGALGRKPGALKDRLLGDGLVPLDSALGRHRDPARSLHFAPGHQWVGRGLGHLDLLDSPEVLAQLQHWLLPAAAA